MNRYFAFREKEHAHNLFEQARLQWPLYKGADKSLARPD